MKKPYVLIWGGGDLASGIAMRLNRVGIRALVVEMDQPRMVRRSVSFAQAVYDGDTRVEDIPGKLVTSPVEAEKCWEKGIMPVIVDPQLTLIKAFPPLALVDARMRKKQVPLSLDLADLLIGLGPGFIAGKIVMLRLRPTGDIFGQGIMGRRFRSAHRHPGNSAGI